MNMMSESGARLGAIRCEKKAPRVRVSSVVLRSWNSSRVSQPAARIDAIPKAKVMRRGVKNRSGKSFRP
jgi:hypothetical protein